MRSAKKIRRLSGVVLASLCLASASAAEQREQPEDPDRHDRSGRVESARIETTEGRNLRPRLSQRRAERLPLKQLRLHGRRIFSTPFNRGDGLGDGPMDPADPVTPGGRPAMQSATGFFLRLNGLDSQTCLECHSVLSNATIPARFAVGGVGGIAASAFPGVSDADLTDRQGNGFAAIDGRAINPPFSFGAGGIELLAQEMTQELQDLARLAEENPGLAVALVSKGVEFGEIVFDGGALDTSRVEGVDEDLVVRPFGRKGCCATIREFDLNAMQFHHGMQPVEMVGWGVDDDGDGVVDEVLPGEISAMHAFQVTLEPPRETRSRRSRAGRALFEEIGCADCHRPSLTTRSRVLKLRFPEQPEDPDANVYREIDLSRAPTEFRRAGRGIEVPLYADLKRHDMGRDLAETTGNALDRWFHTARLWGVADTAPYLHDGRATTLSEAILMHGGEAEAARDRFEALQDRDRAKLIAFLKTLRTPRDPGGDLD